MDNFILFMTDINEKQFKSILNTLTRTQIKYIKEVVNNILQSVIPLTQEDKKYLTKRRHFLRSLIHRGATRQQLVKEFRVLYRLLKITRRHLE